MGFRIGRAIRRIFRPITNIFKRGGDGGYNEVIEQTQKVEVQYRDPPPDKDYVKLSELTKMIVPFEIKGDITSVNSNYLLAHFGVNKTINLTNEPRLKWTLFGNNYQTRQTYNLKSLIGKNYDKTWLPESDYGDLLYNSVMDKVGKLEDFKELDGYPVSRSWQSGPFECRRQFFVYSIGTTVSVYNRIYKRIGYTNVTLPPVPPVPPPPKEFNVTIVCKINHFEPNRDGQHLYYKRTNDGSNQRTWYYPINNVTLNFKVHYGTVFNVNKLSYNNLLNPISCPQVTITRDESFTYVFQYSQRMNLYARSVSRVNVTENYDWVKYGSGQSTGVPFVFNVVYDRRESRDRDNWRDRHD